MVNIFVHLKKPSPLRSVLRFVSFRGKASDTIKRESGENPGQTRCCEFRKRSSIGSATGGCTLSGKAFEDGTSQKTYPKSVIGFTCFRDIRQRNKQRSEALLAHFFILMHGHLSCLREVRGSLFGLCSTVSCGKQGVV